MPSSRLVAIVAAAAMLAACGTHAQPDAQPAQSNLATSPPQPPGPPTPPVSPYARWSNSLPTDPGFFPLAVWLQDPPNAPGYQQLGINLYVGLWQGPSNVQLQTLQQAGMPVMAAQNSTALAVTNASPVVGWQQPDEPDNAQWNGSGYGPCVPPAVVEANYLQWTIADPTRPVFLNFGQGVAFETWVGRGVCTGQLQMYPDYMRGADIVCFDIYPLNSTYPQVTGNLWYVARGVERLVEWNREYFGGRKIVWNCVELSNIDGQALPTAAQVRAEVWMSIVHGSMGILYFVHEFSPTFHEAAILTRQEPQYQALRAGVTALNAQVQRLAPVLNSPTIEGALSLHNAQPAAPIATMQKRAGGYTYVFAVAMRNVPTTGTFKLDGLPPATTVEVLDEARNLTSVGSTFTDTFTGYQVHIYRFR